MGLGSDSSPPVRIGFVLHSMSVAGAEVLVSEIIERAGARLAPTVLCLDEVGALGHALREQGIEVLELGRRPGLDLRVAGRIARATREHQLELLHAHQYTPFFYSALAKLRPSSRFRLILTEHGRHYPDNVSTRRRLANRLLLERQADAVTGCSEFSRHGLAEIDGFSAARIELIPNGIDLDRFPPGTDRGELRSRIGLDPQRTLIACIARFHPVKDHATLLRAFARVADAHADADLLLAGDGTLRQELEQLSADLGVSERVHFLGVRRDVADILRAADLFCMTSLSEAASLTILEAMAAELPVVVTAVGGNPELVRDGIDGRLVSRGDDQAVAAALSELIADRESAAAMGAAARVRVVAEFDLDQTIAAYLALFERVARNGRSS